MNQQYIENLKEKIAQATDDELPDLQAELEALLAQEAK